MKLTPPTNLTFGLSVLLGIIGLGLGFYSGFSPALVVTLVGLLILAVGNLYEKI